MLSLLQRIVAKVPFVNTFLCSSVPKPAENLVFLYHYRQRNTTVPSQPVIKDPSPGGGPACPGEGYIASFLFEQYVPAVEGTYISNMPTWDGSFN